MLSFLFGKDKPIPRKADGTREYRPKEWLNPHSPHGEGGPPTVKRIQDMYHVPPSFTNLLPWIDYDDTEGTFILADGLGLGALFELRAVGCEARPEAWLADLRDKLQGVLCAIPEADPPWIVQFFAYDEPLRGLAAQIAAYGRDDARATPFAARCGTQNRFRLARLPEGTGRF